MTLKQEELELVAARWLGWKPTWECDGWYRGRECMMPDHWKYETKGYGRTPDGQSLGSFQVSRIQNVTHKHPLPDMTADETFGKLVLALLFGGVRICLRPNSVNVLQDICVTTEHRERYLNTNDNPKAALLQLALDLAKQEQDRLHACGDPNCTVPHPAPHKKRPREQDHGKL